MKKNERELIKTFSEEAKNKFDSIIERCAQLKKKNSLDEKTIKEIISDIRIIKGNAVASKITSIEKMCNALEEIFVGVKDGRLKITNRLEKLLELVAKKILSILKSENFSAEDLSVANYLLYCDRISSGELIDTRAMERDLIGQNEVATDEEEGFESSDGTIAGIHTIRVKLSRINEIITSYDSLITKEFRLKHQLEELHRVEEETGITALSKIRKQLSFDIESLEAQIFDLQQQIFDMRMLPLSMALNPLENEIREVASECKKDVSVEIAETKIMLDKEVLERLGEILSLLVKNTVRKAIGDNPKAKITIACTSDMNSVRLVMKNDGRHLDYEKIRADLLKQFPEKEEEIVRFNEREISAYLFKPNFFDDDNSLAEAHDRVEKIKGRISIENNFDCAGTSFVLRFPLSLATQQGLFVISGGQKLMLPSQHILDVVYRKKDELITLQNQTCLNHEGELVPLYSLDSLIDTNEEFEKKSDAFNIVVAEYMEQKAGIIVGNVLGYVSLAVKPLPQGFEKFKSLQGIVFDEHYAIVPILNLQDIIARFKAMRNYDLKKYEAKSRKIVHKILVVDNSKTTQQIECAALKNAGFFVDIASDGIEATDLLKEKQFDLVVTADEMPRMDGLTLLENMRRDKNYCDVPVVVVFPVADKARQEKYLASGANAFFLKSDFSRDAMISKVKELLNA